MTDNIKNIARQKKGIKNLQSFKKACQNSLDFPRKVISFQDSARKNPVTGFNNQRLFLFWQRFTGFQETGK